MTKQQLQQEIMSCIWSKDLRTYISEHNYTFDSMDLLSISYTYAPSYNERIRLLQLLADHDPDVSEFAARCVRFQQECLEQFCRRGENEVYELRIQDGPDAYEDRYLCASYDTALDMIDGFYREYDFAPETNNVRYAIAKRKILQPGEAFQEDELQECILGAGKVLISAEIWRHEDDPKHSINDVMFPPFIPHLSPVRYRRHDKTIGRGICLGGDHLPTEAFYVIPFDNEILKSGAYEQHPGNHWHEHIPGPLVEILPVEDLTGEEKDIYYDFARYCRQQEQETS